MKFFTPKGLKKSFQVQPEATVWFVFQICLILIFVIIGIIGCVKMYKIKNTNYTTDDLKRERAEEAEEVNIENTSIEDEIEYYDVPLNNELQKHIFNECDKHSISPRLIFAMIERESSYNSQAIGDNGESFGLMQIQPKWNQDRMEKLGCNNLLDPFQNVSVGIDLIAELIKKDKSIEWSLMAYNAGEDYANYMINNNMVSNYAKDVIDISGSISII